jgi:hypothetical protein
MKLPKKCKNSRLTSRRHYNKVSEKKKQRKKSSTRAKAIAPRGTIKVHATMDNAFEFGLNFGFTVASKYFTNPKKRGQHIEGKFREWKSIYDLPQNIHGNVVLDGTVNLFPLCT